MGFFQDFFKTKNYTVGKIGIAECRELLGDDGVEFLLRDLAFQTCVNLISNKIGLCKMREFEKRKEVEGAEAWLWNYEPNKNQNASAFWHKFVSKLYKDGEALIVEEHYGNGIVVADSYQLDDSRPTNVYRSVVIGSRTIDRLAENKVMHIILHNDKIEPLINKMNNAFLRMLSTAQQNYLFNTGQHWKVHVNQTITADNEWLTKFREVIEKQIEPFLKSGSAVLPEVDGYDYKQISGGEGKASTTEFRELYKTVWQETAKAFLIPFVLIDGSVADTSKATERLLADVIDPIAQQITQEAIRKRYSFEDYSNGNYVLFDTSTISHYDLLSNAANVEKLVGAGLWSINELREKLGDTPLEEDWADKHYLTKNIGTTANAE